MKIDWNKKYTTVAVYVLVFSAIGMVIYQLLDNMSGLFNIFSTFIGAISPFLFGFVFAYVLHPILRFFEIKALPAITKRKLTRKTYRSLGILMTFICSISFVAVLFYFIIPELLRNVNTLIIQIKNYAPKIEQTMNEVLVWLHMEDSLAPVVSTITTSVQEFFSQTFVFVSKSLGSIINTTIGITTTVINVFVGMFITVYMWSSKEKLIAQFKKISYAFLPQKFVDKSIVLLREANGIFSGFISGKILDSAIVGLLCYLGMLILNIPYALLISIIIGVTNIIPYFGPFIGAIPSIVLLLIVEPIEAIWFTVFVIILQQIDGNIIGPKILGESTGLSAIWVVFAVTVFGGAFGFVGMIAGVPLFAIIYSVVSRAANDRLRKKNLPINTNEYASEENRLIAKGEKLTK